MFGPRTKGLRLAEPADRAALAGALRGRRVDDAAFSWPLLTLDDDALAHNIATAAAVCAQRGVDHAPHVKTHMSRELWARQAAAGAWGATVATPAQLRTAADWGVPRVYLANELPDPRDAAWLRAALDRADSLDRADVLKPADALGPADSLGPADALHPADSLGPADALDPAGPLGDASNRLLEAWVQVDSPHGVRVLADAFASAIPEVRARLGVLVEVGVPGGRTGVREPAVAVALARSAAEAGLTVRGVAGYEGPVAARTDAAGLAAVATWCDDLRATGEQVRAALGGALPGRLVLSAGGSAFLDVVLDRLRPDATTQVVVRSGAYVTHDHGHYTEADPWSRIPGAAALRPAITVWAQVLSVPEPGLALLGLGRRDVSFDLDLPYPLWARTPGSDGTLGAPRDLSRAGARVTALNDQHAFVHLDDAGLDPAPLAPGDVVGLGISHPCTTLDKWRVAVVTRGDEVLDLYALDL